MSGITRKRWVIPATVMLGLVIAGIHYGSMHYREVGSTTKKFREHMVVEHIASKPFDIGLGSLMLGLCGILCALAAARKGYTASDKVNGYEDVTRDKLATEAAYDGLKQVLGGQVDGVGQRIVEGASNCSLTDKVVLAELAQDVPALAMKCRQAIKLNAQDVATGESLIGRWRRLNLSIRTDGVTPAYFKEPADLTSLRLAEDELGRDELVELIDAARVTFASGKGEMQDAIADARRVVDAAKDNVEAIMEMLGRGEDDDTSDGDVAQVRAFLLEELKSQASPLTSERDVA